MSTNTLTFEGCNFFRQRLVLSTLSGKTVKIRKIRSTDDNPGLRGIWRWSNMEKMWTWLCCHEINPVLVIDTHIRFYNPYQIRVPVIALRHIDQVILCLYPLTLRIAFHNETDILILWIPLFFLVLFLQILKLVLSGFLINLPMDRRLLWVKQVRHVALHFGLYHIAIL